MFYSERENYHHHLNTARGRRSGENRELVFAQSFLSKEIKALGKEQCL